MEILLASAFTIGLLGSLHCIGMCGGLVTAITISREKVWWPGLISYQLARIGSYMVLGSVIATIGISLQGDSDLQFAQVWLGYFAAAIMVLFALNLGGWLPDPLSRFTAGIMRMTGLSHWSRRANEQDKFTPWLMVGMLNGLLPCGLVYAGLALSLTASTLVEGALVMLAFGLGTLPAMLATPYLIRTIAPQLRGTLLKIAAIALIILAIFTASRNLLHSDHHHASSDNTQPHAGHVMPPESEQSQHEHHNGHDMTPTIHKMDHH